jgi:hypothetical protein
MRLHVIQDLALARIITSQHISIHSPQWAQTHRISTWCFHKIIEYEDGHTKSALVPFDSCLEKAATIRPCIAIRPCCISTLLHRIVVVINGWLYVEWLQLFTIRSLCLRSRCHHLGRMTRATHAFVPCGATLALYDGYKERTGNKLKF